MAGISQASADTAANPSPQREPIARNLYLIVGLFVAIIVCILVLDRFQAYMLDSVRAYVAAENFWSKGQKDATYHLQRYATTHDEHQYRLFQQGIAVTLGDRAARLALQASPPDTARARAGFLAGHNHAEDVSEMIDFFLRFSDIGPMQQAIAIWTAGDQQIDVMRRLGQTLHEAIAKGGPDDDDDAGIQRIMDRIESTNIRLTRQETRFSSTLEDAAREIRSLTGTAMIASTLLLLALGIILAGRIIGGTRRVQAAMAASEARFRHIVESNIVGVAFWDNDGTIVDANDAYLDTIGYSRQDLKEGRINWRTLTPEEYRAQDAEAIRQMQEQGYFRPVEKEYLHKDGHRVAVSIGAARFDAHGGVGLLLDINERRRLEERLQQIQKMEAIATLVGGIAHDFNNTLAAVQGNLYLAKQYAKDNARVAEKLAIIERLSTHSAEIVRQLLTFANKGIVRMEPMSLNTLCTRISRQFVPSLAEGVAFDMALCDEDLTIKGDGTQLEQVMLHLLNNARDAVAGAKAPAIRCSLSRFTPDAAFTAKHARLAEGPLAHLQVADNGCGMSETQLAHIFEPFYTTKEVGQGTGLGMAMVYGSMKTHKGAVTVDSAEGRGTVVDLYLPLIKADAA